MDRFTFIKETIPDGEDYSDTTKVSMVVENCETWINLVQHFQHFLGGCGFIVPETDINFKELLEEEHRNSWVNKHAN